MSPELERARAFSLNNCDCGLQVTCIPHQAIAIAIKESVEQEREACAAIVDKVKGWTAEAVAKKIRMRGK